MFTGNEHGHVRAGAIHVDDLVLEYPLYHNIVQDRLRALVGLLIPSLKPPAKRVLQRVSLRIEPGEVVGIVGMNGAGKTSLVKALSGLVRPTEGTVQVGGRVMALLATGVGFRPTFTGRENLRYGGLLLGMEARQVEEMIPEIEKFAELEEALDQPFFTYSAGMRARLGFSLATSVPADILMLDETLASGDGRFVAKCYRRLKEIQASGKTILFVSHNLGEVARLTSRVIVLRDGSMKFDGDVFEGLKVYETTLADARHDAETICPELKDVEVSLLVRDDSGRLIRVVELGQRVSIELKINSRKALGESFVFLRMITMETNQLYAYFMPQRWKSVRQRSHDRDSVGIKEGETTITWTLPYWTCGEGDYFFDAYVGPACSPEAPDISSGRFWRHAARVTSVYGNAYLKGANSAVEIPVEAVSISTP